MGLFPFVWDADIAGIGWSFSGRVLRPGTDFVFVVDDFAGAVAHVGDNSRVHWVSSRQSRPGLVEDAFEGHFGRICVNGRSRKWRGALQCSVGGYALPIVLGDFGHSVHHVTADVY